MSNNKQQTAVEWLIETMHNSQGMTQSDIDNVFEQAKEMEKEQIKEAREDGHTSTYTEYDSDTKLYLEGRHEQYYEQTYGGGEQ